MRPLILLVAATVALSACKPSGPGGPDRAAGAASAAGAPLLIAPEDTVTLAGSLLASGPVVSGSLQPARRADLRAEVGAVVLQVLKENGEAVQAGELLVRLDDAAIRDSLVSAQEAVRASSQSFDGAERQLARLKTLQVQGMTSLQALEDAEVRRNNVQSDLVAARARLATAQQQLRRTEVRAPFAGVVSDRKVSAGDTAQVGKELLKVIDPASLRFEGLVSADRMGELQVGQPVRFRVNGLPQTEFTGKLARIDATANATTRQVALIVNFSEPAQAPRMAGLFAEGRVETGGTQVLMLNDAALVRSGDSAQAWKIDGSVLRKVTVTLGDRDPRSGRFPVLKGLVAGDRVLRAPSGNLRDGQPIEFARPPAAAAPPAAVAASAASATR
jgi:membrane fusion protein, multidrug efflux system